MPAARGGGGRGGAQTLVCPFSVSAHGVVWPAVDVGCHPLRATHPSPLSLFEAHASPCGQRPGAWGSVIFSAQRPSSSWTDCDSQSPLSEVSSDLKPKPALLASPCGCWESSFRNFSFIPLASSPPGRHRMIPRICRQWRTSVLTPCHGGLAPSAQATAQGTG